MRRPSGGLRALPMKVVYNFLTMKKSDGVARTTRVQIMRRLSDDVPGQDFIDWAEPLIVDRLADVYAQTFPHNRLRADTFVALHARVWCVIIGGDLGRGTRLRRELAAEYAKAHLPQDALLEADRAVVDELHTVIRQRFRASRHLSAAYVAPLHQAMQQIRTVKMAA